MSRCGTTRSYRNGCRCDACTDAIRVMWAKANARRRHTQYGDGLPELSEVLQHRPWTEHAACKGKTNLFETISSERPSRTPRNPQTNAARALCRTCPVLDECRKWILAHQQDPCPHHIVAGMTRSERAAHRRNNRHNGNEGAA